MVAHVLRLRVTLLLGSLRGRGGQVARTVGAFIVLLGATVIAGAALLSLRDAPVADAQAVIVMAGSALTLSCALAPLIGGLVDPLDPRRFAVLGMSPSTLSGALALAAFVSVPVAALAALAVCVAIVWIDHGVPLALATVGSVTAVVTCVLVSRVSMAIAALVLRRRRSRGLTGLFALALVMIAVPTAVFVASLEWRGRVPAQVQSAVDVLSKTPLGASWAVGGESASGQPGGLTFGILALTIALLGAAWFALVGRMLTHTERPAAARHRGGMGWFVLTPGTPGGAIAARSLVYWLRDSRYLVNMVVVPVVALLAAVPPLLVGVPLPLVALIPVPIMALFFGWLPHNDVAFDSTAVWMHVASGVRGFSDRVGRLAPILLIAIPVLAVSIPVAVHFTGRPALLPAVIGVAAALFLSGVGLSSISSVMAPYAVSRPGDSPFMQPQRSGSGGVLSQGLVMFGAVAASAPTLWWAWLAVSEDIVYASDALQAGLITGGLVLAGGITVGSLVFRRRGARLMEFAGAS